MQNAREEYSLASVVGINTLNVEVATLLEQLHQDRLDTLALVQHRFGADFQSADVVEVDGVFLDQARQGGKGNGIDVCRGTVSQSSVSAYAIMSTDLLCRRKTTSGFAQDRLCICPPRRHRTSLAQLGQRTGDVLACDSAARA